MPPILISAGAVILSQIRTISSKRLIRKIRTYPKDDFKIATLKIELEDLL